MYDKLTGRFVKLTLEERFWSKVNKSGPVPSHCPELGECWIWTAGINSGGYGRLHSGSENSTPAHRVSWELANGAVPDGMLVLHRCDICRCVRPAHLFLGSHADNIADKVAKSRQPRGETNGMANLTELQVRDIYEFYPRTAKRGPRSKEHKRIILALCAKHGISLQLASRIAYGNRWGWFTTSLSPKPTDLVSPQA